MLSIEAAVKKGKSVSVIADELEEEERILQLLRRNERKSELGYEKKIKIKNCSLSKLDDEQFCIGSSICFTNASFPSPAKWT